jgi:hypothetical protein
VLLLTLFSTQRWETSRIPCTTCHLDDRVLPSLAHHSPLDETEPLLPGGCSRTLKIGDFVSEHEKIYQWLNADDMRGSSSLLWISGFAGSGKTALSLAIVDYLRNDRRAGEAIVHCFADRSLDNSNLAVNIIQTTAIKLLERETFDKPRHILKTLLNDLYSAGGKLSRPQIREFFQRIKHSLDREETLYLVLDGLDAVEESQNTIDLLHEIMDLGSRYDRLHPIKVLISSRPDFLDRRSLQGALHLDIDKTTSIRSNGYHSLVQRLAANSESTSPWNLSDPIKELRDMSSVYQDIIGRISEKDRAVSLQMLRWVTYAARPLRTWELLDAINSQMSIKLAESDIQRICGGLLKTTEGTVNLVHFSLRHYLQSQSDENDILGWRAVSGTTHEMIAHSCFRILSSEHLLRNPSATTLVDLPGIIENEQSHGLQSYAQWHWRYHYAHAERQSSYLAGMLHEKLRNGWERDGTSKGSQNSPNQSSVAFLNAALAEGARSGMPKLVKLELDMGANPNTTDEIGNTPLHLAAAAGNSEVVKLLIGYGGDVNVASNSGSTALFHAIASGSFETVKILLVHGSNLFGNYSGTYQNENGHKSPLPVFQNLALVVSLLCCCSGCGSMRSHYVVSTFLFLTRF